MMQIPPRHYIGIGKFYLRH